MVDSSAFLEKVLESARIFFLLRLSRLVIKKYTVHGPHHLLIEQVTKLDRKNRRRGVKGNQYLKMILFRSKQAYTFGDFGWP